MKKMLLALLLIASSASAQEAPPETAEIHDVQIPLNVYHRGVAFDFQTNTLILKGDFTQTMFMMARLAILTHGSDIQRIIISGPGGLYFESLEIGRMVYELQIPVLIEDDKVCASACAFIAIAGSEIDIQGELRLHHPFFSVVPINQSIQEIVTRFGYGFLEMADYLIEIGYGFDMAYDIVQLTTPCRYISIETDIQLSRYFAEREGVDSDEPTIVETCEF